MATTESTPAEPAEEAEITVLNRHTPVAPVGMLPDTDAPQQPSVTEQEADTPETGTKATPRTKPQENRHTPAPAD